MAAVNTVVPRQESQDKIEMIYEEWLEQEWRMQGRMWIHLNLGERSTGKHLASFSETHVTQQFSCQHQAEDTCLEWTGLAAGPARMTPSASTLSALSHPLVARDRKMSKVCFTLCCVASADSKVQIWSLDTQQQNKRKRWESLNTRQLRASCPLRFSRKLCIFREENPQNIK